MSDVLMGSGVSSVGGAGSMTSQTLSVGNGSDQDSDSGAPFSGLFKSMVAQTKALDDQASQTVTGLLSGQGVDVHQAMIATQKANMAFELALQVRNKAVGAYQQMMGMQF